MHAKFPLQNLDGTQYKPSQTEQSPDRAASKVVCQIAQDMNVRNKAYQREARIKLFNPGEGAQAL